MPPVKIGADKINGESANTARAEMKSSYQSVCDILKRVEDIKKAINKANAEIIITVCGEEMSVASALYMMNYGLDVKKKLLSSMRQQYITAKQNVEYKNGSELENKVNKFVETMYGGKEKANSSEAIGAIEDYRKKNSYEYLVKGHHIKVSIRFKGRQMAHTEVGQEVMERFAESLKEVADVESKPVLEGRTMIMM